MTDFLYYYFNVEVMLRYLPDMLKGFVLTVEVAVLVLLIGIPLGLLGAVLRTYGIKPLNWLIIFLVDLFRSLPLLVVVVLSYFALPSVGVILSPFWATVASLSAVLAAFSEEIFWAGLSSVPAGQFEAARSTGLPFTVAIFLVILPQAIKLAIPPLTNRAIAITKGTSLGSVIALQELLAIATSTQSVSASPSPLTLGAALYLVLFFPFVVLTRWLEKRYSRRGAT